MGLRETLNQKKSVSVGAAVLLFVVAGGYLAYTQWPRSALKGDEAFYTVDDGQTWFVDSIYKTPPFDYEGKTAVRAMVYSYANGKKTFCPFLVRYDDGMKKKLDAEISQANQQGKPLSSISLFNAPGTDLQEEIKLPGPGHRWVSRGNVDQAAKVLGAATAPDGSDSDLVIPR
jgi:hypothetical protein